MLKTHTYFIENACDTLNKLRPHIYGINLQLTMMTQQLGIDKVDS